MGGEASWVTAKATVVCLQLAPLLGQPVCLGAPVPAARACCCGGCLLRGNIAGAVLRLASELHIGVGVVWQTRVLIRAFVRPPLLPEDRPSAPCQAGAPWF